jgi:hypothetical protein
MIVLDARKSILLDLQFVCRYGSDADILSSITDLGGSQLLKIYPFNIAVTTEPLMFLCIIKCIVVVQRINIIIQRHVLCTFKLPNE